MKKIVAAVLAVFTVIFSGCYNPVFYNIEREVELTKGSVPGTINAIVRFHDSEGDWLVLSNGSDVYYKKEGVVRDGSDSVWTKRANSVFEPVGFSYYDQKYNGRYILKTAADKEFVYILTVCIKDNLEGQNEPYDYKLYYTDKVTGDSWTEISVAEDVFKNATTGTGDDIKANVTVFCSNSENVDGRSAYLRSYIESDNKYVYYKLGKELVQIEPAVRGDAGKADAEERVKSVVNYAGQDIFFASEASVSAKDCYYFAVEDDIYRMKNGDAEPTLIFNAPGKVLSMAVTADYLIFGCGDASSYLINDGGIYHLSIDKISDKKLEVSDPFDTNADAVMTTSYEVRSLLVEDSSKKEADAIIFSSIVFKSAGTSISVSYENKGLWAYYPVRGNWNRE